MYSMPVVSSRDQISCSHDNRTNKHDDYDLFTRLLCNKLPITTTGSIDVNCIEEKRIIIF